MAKRRAKHWFWAWTVLATVQKHQQRDPKARCEVWENLIIVHAHTPREALQKAEKIGRSAAGDCRGSLRLDGKPAVCKFMGVASFGLVHDKLVDGAELTWRLKKCTQATAAKLPKRRAALIAETKKELDDVTRAATRAALEPTAALHEFTFHMIKTDSVEATLAPGGGRSSLSR